MFFSSGIHLQFLNLSTEAIHDYLEIRSGTLETGSVIDRFSGPIIPKPLFSTTHQTSFSFHSDYSQNKPGFHIVYQGKCWLCKFSNVMFTVTISWAKGKQKQMSPCCFFQEQKLLTMWEHEWFHSLWAFHRKIESFNEDVRKQLLLHTGS